MRTLPTSLLLLLTCLSTNLLFSQASAQTEPEPARLEAEMEPQRTADASVLDAEQWQKVDASVQRALKWLATKQNADGSFESPQSGQPAITAFCLMAFLAQGESPANGAYQEQLIKAIDFITDQQKANGIIATIAPHTVPIPRDQPREVSVPSVYNHAISGLVLAEAYGQCTPEQAERIAPIIEKGIAATLEMQSWGPKLDRNVGGWRYMDSRFPKDNSDLSVTGWQLMFLRAAKNAGFEVPRGNVDQAVKYVESCFLKNDDRQVHAYLAEKQRACTRGMAGAGVLALAHAGKHNSKEAIASGDWILKNNFKVYNENTAMFASPHWQEHFHYGSFLCTQAMFQLGGKYWTEFYPPLIEMLLANQQADGAWPPEKEVPQYGNCYTTSLCILSMSVPNQVLPIFQR